MVILSDVTYPPESAGEVAKRYLRAPALPDFLVKRGPFLSADWQGVHSITFYELPNDKLAQGLTAVGDSMAIYFGVPGYLYEVKPYFELEEGLSMIGM